MTAQPMGTPPALAHNLRYNKVLHEHVVILMVSTTHTPQVPPEEQVTVDRLGHGLFSVRIRYGFMQDPNVPQALLLARGQGLDSTSTTSPTSSVGKRSSSPHARGWRSGGRKCSS